MGEDLQGGGCLSGSGQQTAGPWVGRRPKGEGSPVGGGLGEGLSRGPVVALWGRWSSGTLCCWAGRGSSALLPSTGVEREPGLEKPKGLLAGYLAPSSPPGQVLSSTFNRWDLEAHQGLWGRWSRSRSPGLRGPALRPLRLCVSRGLDGTGWARDHHPQRLWLEPWVGSLVGQVSPGTGWARLADDPRSRAQGGDIAG